MQIELTGNPFVDTGLGVIACLADKQKIDDLTLNDLRKVHGDGKLLARRNSKLKSMTMIFSNNSLATNPAIKDHEMRINYYGKITTAILNKISKEDIDERCESCGNSKSLDIDNVIRDTLVPLGYSDNVRYVGRDWFPLAGSMGSDAQALPSSSRAPNICAKCLFAVHYLPLGVILMNGRLVVFQSTSKEFWYDLVCSIVKQIEERVSANNRDTIGSKEGDTAAVKRLLAVMRNLHDEPGPGTSLFVWQFSNSGTGSDCRFEEIPNAALHFLFEAVRHVPEREITDFVNADKKRNPEYSLLNSILKRADYVPLYPFKKFNGASNKLFALYQTLVRNIPLETIATSYKIASYIRANVNKKELDSLGKDIEDDPAKRNYVSYLIATMIRAGLLSYDEYSDLFLDNASSFLRINYDAWKFIKYYLRNEDADLDDLKHFANSTASENANKLAMQQLKYVASTIFNSILENKGIERLANLLGDKHTKISVPWFRHQFVIHAERNEGFTYNDWKTLCFSDSGRDISIVVLFQLRLLWIEWMTKGSAPKISYTKQSGSELPVLETDLPSNYKDHLTTFLNSYIEKKGISKLQKNILDDLRRGEKSLYWFRQTLASVDKRLLDEDYWDQFLQDPNGNYIPSLRLFQMHLIVANYFREQAYKQQLQVTQ